MIKYALIAAIATSAGAHAQVAKIPTSAVTAEQAKSAGADSQYCTYEDKKYTEGAVKKADGVVMICMREESFTTMGPSSAQLLIWEPATSARGRSKLNLKSSADVFK